MRIAISPLIALLLTPLDALQAAEANHQPVPPASTPARTAPLEMDFRDPPAATRPFVYWYWINNNVSREGLRKDLQAMAQVGIGGVSIAHIEYKDTPYGNVPIFSDEWWDCMTVAMEEAARLGIEVNLFNSPGWSGVGGAWVKPEQAMRYLDVHEYRVTGPKKLVMQLPSYESNERLSQSSLSFQYEIDKSRFRFQPVALQAFPAPEGSADLISARRPLVTSTPEIKGVEALFDGDEAAGVSFHDLPVTIELSVKEPFTVRSLEVVPANAPSAAWCRLEYLDAKGAWVSVVSRRITRSENRIIASGWWPFAPVSASFPAVSARRFRLTLSDTEGGAASPSKKAAASQKEKACLAEIKLWGASRVDSYAEKQMGNKAAYAKPDAATIRPDEAGYAVRKGEVRDLAAHVDAHGQLTWEVPDGDWIIQHAGMHQTGVPTHPVPVGPTRGFAADILSRDASEACFDAYIGQILRRIPPEKRKTLTRIVLDSYEQGSANWTDGFAGTFQAAYGYDPLPWTPVLRGHVVESAEQSDRFLWDLRRLVADVMPETFAGAIQQKARQHGLTLWHEPYAGHGFPGECLLLGKYTDMPAGEFWLRKAPGAELPQCRAGSSVANVYGRNIVSVEAFTSAGTLYKAMPRDFKTHGDWALAQGLNHFTLHVYVHQPEDRRPGINTWYGTEFNRNNNWFQHGKPFVDYLRRSCALLQRGQRQTDIAFYIGDEVPCDTPKLDYVLPRGLDHDFVNYDVLMNRATVSGGRMVLPSGASYRLLVLPKSSTMRPELLQKLDELVNAGLIVYGPRPVRSPSLKGFPACDVRVRDIAGRLWGNIDGKNVVSNRCGSGMVFFGPELSDIIARIELNPDVGLPEGFVFTHRQADGADIYWIANQKDEPRTAEISFRVAGGQPERWDALTGEIRPLHQFVAGNGRTSIPLQFDPAGSCFIVFRGNPIPPEPSRRNFPSFKPVQTISGTWDVTFAGSVNPPFQRTFDRLVDWTSSSEKEIRYFCGKATYGLSFNFDGKQPGPWFLNLGRVESLARIRLNDREVATLWCHPYRAGVSEFLVKGENRLEIEMVNPWWNQLIGDEQPGANRTTTVSARLFWKAGDPLLPSGLLGPVVLETRE